jgi:hypothetical protein
MNNESYTVNANAKPLNKAMMQWFVSHVFESAEQVKDKRIDLVNADLKGLPSATLIRAEIEIRSLKRANCSPNVSKTPAAMSAATPIVAALTNFSAWASS